MNTTFTFTSKKMCGSAASFWKNLMIFSCLFVSSLGMAQKAEYAMHYESYHWDVAQEKSQNKGNNQEISHLVEIPDARWLRLHFDQVNLSKGSYVEITSLQDGATQVLNQEVMEEWENSSAYFNGNRVKVTLHQTGEKSQNLLRIAKLEVGEVPAVTKSQCGNYDDRWLDYNSKVGRLVPIGCTGWIIRNGKIVTAGHCTGSRMQVLEFNVPMSNRDGSLNHPAPKDQYSVKSYSVKTGQYDWAVFEVYANSQTGKTPIQAQQWGFDVKQVYSANSIKISGYGVDRDTRDRNQVQQAHIGPYAGSSYYYLWYSTDTEGGNSGSPVIDNSTGYAIGVHTNGGCGAGGGSNRGTNARLQEFWNAMGLGYSVQARENIEDNVGGLEAQTALESAEKQKVSLYTQGKLLHVYRPAYLKSPMVKVHNHMGQLVYEGILKNAENSYVLEKKGAYVVSVISDQTVWNKKIYIP